MDKVMDKKANICFEKAVSGLAFTCGKRASSANNRKV